MKLNSVLTTAVTTVALAGIITIWDSPLKAINPNLVQASAQAMPDSTGLTLEQKIQRLTEHRGMFGSGDELRRYFFGDLEPLGVQPGGAGMVVNLYNKANNMTFAYCSTYDVVVALRTGRVTEFEASEVK
jgi:hypothetical protein